MLRTGFARLDRLRFAETESLDSRASSGLADGHWLDLSSGVMGGRGSVVLVSVACPASQWATERATLMAILASMRFSRPKG